MNMILSLFYILIGIGMAENNSNMTPVIQIKSFRIGKDVFKIKYINGIGASPQCFEKTGCTALNAETISIIKKVKSSSRIGGANPGALVCHRIPGVEVVVGTNDSSGNQQSFCLFQDKSMLSTQSVINLRK